MRHALAIAALLTCAACATDGAGPQSYSLGRGALNYDTLRQEGEKCAGLGGALRSKEQGSANMLSNYYCDIPKGK